MTRFCKSRLLADLEDSAMRLKARHGFTRNKGTKQVENKNPATNRAYGEWDMLMRLIENIQGGFIGK